MRGRSPCGLEYSIEATLAAPQNHPFSAVAGALRMLGEVKYEEDLGAAVVKTDYGRATAFANGHIMIIAGKLEAEELLQKGLRDHPARADVHEMPHLHEELQSKGDYSERYHHSRRDEVQSLRKMCQRLHRCRPGCEDLSQARQTDGSTLGSPYPSLLDKEALHERTIHPQTRVHQSLFDLCLPECLATCLIIIKK